MVFRPKGWGQSWRWRVFATGFMCILLSQTDWAYSVGERGEEYYVFEYMCLMHVLRLPGPAIPESGGVQQSRQVWEPHRGPAAANLVGEAWLQSGHLRHPQQNQAHQKRTGDSPFPSLSCIELWLICVIHGCLPGHSTNCHEWIPECQLCCIFFQKVEGSLSGGLCGSCVNWAVSQNGYF